MSRRQGSGTLVFFSAQYPSELTIANEMAIIAPHFERVLYLPTVLRVSDPDPSHPLPPNVTILDVVAANEARPRPRDMFVAMSLLVQALTRTEDRGAYRRHFRTYARLLGDQLGRARALEAFIRERGLRDALFYDYWFENSTLALALLRSRGVVRRAFSRAHRFDLYDDPAENWVVPFRRFKAEHLDSIMPISEDGATYLKQKLPLATHRKILVSRLGVPDEPPAPTGSARPLVVSCSYMKPFKQVQMIPTLLSQVGIPLRWVHFGDGPLFEETKRRAELLPPEIEWDLRGDVRHEDVIRFFRATPVSLFISLSLSEGIPVSMMEALSFGIPVMGYGVCGIPELVNDETGVLLDPSWPIEMIAKLLHATLVSGNFDRAAIVRFQRARFSMRQNYEGFARLIEQM